PCGYIANLSSVGRVSPGCIPRGAVSAPERAGIEVAEARGMTIDSLETLSLAALRRAVGGEAADVRSTAARAGVGAGAAVIPPNADCPATLMFAAPLAYQTCQGVHGAEAQKRFLEAFRGGHAH